MKRKKEDGKIRWADQKYENKPKIEAASDDQLELDMELQTGSKLGKKYIKAVYCHPACITYMQSTS